MSVAQVITHNVATCGEEDTIASLMERMTAGKFRHLPEVVKGELKGIVSIGDVVKQRVGEIESEPRRCVGLITSRSHCRRKAPTAR